MGLVAPAGGRAPMRLKDLLTHLNGIVQRIAGGEDPDQIALLWDNFYTSVPVADRTRFEGLHQKLQSRFIRSLYAEGRLPTDWIIIRLAGSEPFQRWAEWQERARLPGGPMVGQDVQARKGYLVPVRAFVLDAKAKDTDAPDLRIWPYGRVPVSLHRRMPGILRLCWIRNLLGLFVEPLPIALLTLTAVSLAGLLVLGSRSEATLRGCLITSFASSLSLACFVAWEFLAEILLVWREGWVRIWKTSLIQVVGDPTHAIGIEGDSSGLALVLTAFSGLADRVWSENDQPFPRSRFWKMMVAFRENRARYAATGRISGLFGSFIAPVGPTALKREAVDRARLPEFLVPVTFADVYNKIGEIFSGRHRARLRLRLFVPAAAMKLAGTFRAGNIIASLLAIAVFIPARGEYTLMRRIYPPAVDGPARWWPRTVARRDVSRLDIRFKGIEGNPSDYFVIVEGSTAAASSGRAGGIVPPPEITVTGRAALMSDASRPGAARADVSLKLAGGAPDPHRLFVVLFEQRKLAGRSLPPVRVSTFGIPDIEVEEGPAP